MTELTNEQQAEIIAHSIINATKKRIIGILGPNLYKLAEGHHHMDKALVDAILTDINNA